MWIHTFLDLSRRTLPFLAGHGQVLTNIPLIGLGKPSSLVGNSLHLASFHAKSPQPYAFERGAVPVEVIHRCIRHLKPGLEFVSSQPPVSQDF